MHRIEGCPSYSIIFFKIINYINSNKLKINLRLLINNISHGNNFIILHSGVNSEVNK
ncbi:hypothetical protein XBI1_1870103 [Xenorhabdus bovienii str. Intermedium]|uniref:Uncharacterized protein n=1 Tax=Xenorhabdus bovienii str. Intermedium TaxID=1379677 RepID=A0A077Q7G7_XENBV|nr:hypothetical protein XBI1_1870103 [Xenorhabdus bovienii str. Intermedium]